MRKIKAKTKVRQSRMQTKQTRRKTNRSNSRIIVRRFKPRFSVSHSSRSHACKGGSGGPEIPVEYPQGGSSENQLPNREAHTRHPRLR